MKVLKIGILIIFLLLLFCEFQFSNWRIRDVILENTYYIFFYTTGIISITFVLKYLIERLRFSPILIASFLTGIFAVIYCRIIGVNVEIKEMIIPIILMCFLCFAISLVYLSILKSNKIVTIILNSIAIILIGFFQVNQIDLASKYLSDKKVLSENNSEKVVIRNIKNMKSNEITQDTIKVKDIGIFRKKLN